MSSSKSTTCEATIEMLTQEREYFEAFTQEREHFKAIMVGVKFGTPHNDEEDNEEQYNVVDVCDIDVHALFHVEYHNESCDVSSYGSSDDYSMSDEGSDAGTTASVRSHEDEYRSDYENIYGSDEDEDDSDEEDDDEEQYNVVDVGDVDVHAVSYVENDDEDSYDSDDGGGRDGDERNIDKEKCGTIDRADLPSILIIVLVLVATFIMAPPSEKSTMAKNTLSTMLIRTLYM